MPSLHRGLSQTEVFRTLPKQGSNRWFPYLTKGDVGQIDTVEYDEKGTHGSAKDELEMNPATEDEDTQTKNEMTAINSEKNEAAMKATDIVPLEQVLVRGGERIGRGDTATNAFPFPESNCAGTKWHWEERTG